MLRQIKYDKGDIFKSKAQTIVNPVNCEGYMGKGLALAFKERYPDMFVLYQKECRTGKLRIGKPTLYSHSTPDTQFPHKEPLARPLKIRVHRRGLTICCSQL